jgi:hypothetical protein
MPTTNDDRRKKTGQDTKHIFFVLVVDLTMYQGARESQISERIHRRQRLSRNNNGKAPKKKGLVPRAERESAGARPPMKKNNLLPLFPLSSSCI